MLEKKPSGLGAGPVARRKMQMALKLASGPAVTTQDADSFELSASCVGVVPSLAPAEFCTTLSSQRHQNVFDQPKASPLNVSRTSEGVRLGYFGLWVKC